MHRSTGLWGSWDIIQDDVVILGNDGDAIACSLEIVQDGHPQAIQPAVPARPPSLPAWRAPPQWTDLHACGHSPHSQNAAAYSTQHVANALLQM